MDWSKRKGHIIENASTNCKTVVPPPGSCLSVNSADTVIHYSFDMAQQVCIHTPTQGRRELHMFSAKKHISLTCHPLLPFSLCIMMNCCCNHDFLYFFHRFIIIPTRSNIFFDTPKMRHLRGVLKQCLDR